MAPVAINDTPVDTVSQLKQNAAPGPPLPKWQSPPLTKQDRKLSLGFEICQLTYSRVGRP
jgi:hypothetical protein